MTPIVNQLSNKKGERTMKRLFQRLREILVPLSFSLLIIICAVLFMVFWNAYESEERDKEKIGYYNYELVHQKLPYCRMLMKGRLTYDESVEDYDNLTSKQNDGKWILYYKKGTELFDFTRNKIGTAEDQFYGILRGYAYFDVNGAEIQSVTTKDISFRTRGISLPYPPEEAKFLLLNISGNWVDFEDVECEWIDGDIVTSWEW